LQEEGTSVEVIDLRSLIPLDEEMIIKSLKKTNRLLVVHEDKVHGGFGGEISSIIAEKAFEYLDAPIRRVGSTFTPVGFNRILERAILPDAERIYKAAKELVEY
jgi:2-oxoisovalerate dehydrogenase E1 component